MSVHVNVGVVRPTDALRESPDWYNALEARVTGWPWYSPDPNPRVIGIQRVLSGIARGVGLRGSLVVDRQGGGMVDATVALTTEEGRELPPGSLRSFTCSDPVPLVAALMACWLACIRLGRAPPAELDEMMSDALEREALMPSAFGVRWENVEDLFPGRPCPTHVLARASIAIATQGPGR